MTGTGGGTTSLVVDGAKTLLFPTAYDEDPIYNRDEAAVLRFSETGTLVWKQRLYRNGTGIFSTRIATSRTRVAVLGDGSVVMSSVVSTNSTGTRLVGAGDVEQPTVAVTVSGGTFAGVLAGFGSNGQPLWAKALGMAYVPTGTETAGVDTQIEIAAVRPNPGGGFLVTGFGFAPYQAAVGGRLKLAADAIAGVEVTKDASKGLLELGFVARYDTGGSAQWARACAPSQTGKFPAHPNALVDAVGGLVGGGVVIAGRGTSDMVCGIGSGSTQTISLKSGMYFSALTSDGTTKGSVPVEGWTWELDETNGRIAPLPSGGAVLLTRVSGVAGIGSLRFDEPRSGNVVLRVGPSGLP